MTNPAQAVVECRDVYEADMRARMRRAHIAGEPYLKSNPDGTYRRVDLERDYQAFRAAWNADLNTARQRIAALKARASEKATAE